MEHIKTFQVIWADIDANRHMRHTAYNDYAAQARVSFFTESGFSIDQFARLQIGPILFREETMFLKEVGLNEIIKIDIALAGMREDGSRWRITHNIYKSNGEKAATITVDGAWMDLVKRKLTAPPAELIEVVKHMKRTENFDNMESKKA